MIPGSEASSTRNARLAANGAPPNKGVAADERGLANWLKRIRSRAGFRAEHRSMRSAPPARLMTW
jgi:hypothetical protein